MLLGIPLRILSTILYPIVFLFRCKVLLYMSKRVTEDEVNRVFILKSGYKKWKLYLHPYFWMFCLTTGLCDNYSGYSWYKENLRVKWFGEYAGMLDLAFNNPDEYFGATIIHKLQYFYLCYCWQALRNSHWAFNEWFFREGKWKDSTEKLIYCDPPIGSIYKYWDIMPQLKWDEGNDGGKVLRFQTDDTPIDQIWLCTHLGQKKITFTTYKGNRRYMYCYAKIVYLRPLKLKLIIEHQFGWNYWNGLPILHFKHILRRTLDNKTHNSLLDSIIKNCVDTSKLAKD